MNVKSRQDDRHRWTSYSSHWRCLLLWTSRAGWWLACLVVATTAFCDESSEKPASRSTPELLEILKVEPSVLFPRSEPLAQIAWVTVVNRAKQPMTVTAQITLGDLEARRETPAAIRPGESTFEIHIPDTTTPARLRVVLGDAAGQRLADWESPWQPQRHWVVYITKSAHTDLGYEDYEHVKRRALAQYVDDARKITDATWQQPDANRYRWTIEHLHWLRGCLGERSWPWFRELIDGYVKTGKMGLTGVQTGVHSHWHGVEQLCRSTYWGRRHARDQLGLDLPLYLIADEPGIAWPVAQAWAEAGGRYVINCQNWGWRGRESSIPLIFWWLAPDQRSKVLYSNPGHYGRWSYAKTNLRSGYDKMLEWIPLFLKSIEAGACGDYPYDMFLVSAYRDHEPPGKNEAEAVAAWNRQWRYPELRIDDPTRFMVEMERRWGDKIPTLAGDVTSAWADYVAIDSDTFGRKRAASAQLAVVEGLASVVRLLDSDYLLPQRRVDEAYWKLCEFDEHCWPTGRTPDDVQETNTVLFKHHNVDVVERIVGNELERVLQSIVAKVPCPGEPTIVVVNPLAHPRTDLTSVPLAELGNTPDDMSLIETTTGESVPCQRAGDRLMFLARNSPAFGYQTYTVNRNPAREVEGILKAETAVLENRFYRIVFDEVQGTITSLLDKELGRELVDRSAPHGLNQYIYDHRTEPKGTEGFQVSPAKMSRMTSEVGPLFATMRVETSEPRSGAEIIQTVTLYRDLKRVDIKNELRHVRAMGATPRYTNNVFIAFPLHVPGATTRAEYAVGTVRPHEDQLHVGTQDYLVVQRYVDCSNEDYGVIWTTREAPVVHFAEIRYNQFSKDYQPKKPWLYSYAMSNRMAGLVWHHPDRCCATLHYSITSHAGSWPSGDAAAYGWQRGNPLVATVVRQPHRGTLAARQSFIQIDAPNVQMTAFKSSELPGRGFIVRLVETEGRPETLVKASFPSFHLSHAANCNLVEDDQEELPRTSDGQGFEIKMGRHGLATVRLVPRGRIPPPVAHLQLEAQSDSTIRLTWPAVSGATSYRVYRLPGAGESVCLDHLVAETNQTQYVDDALRRGSIYCYRVAAVASGNLEGAPSEEVTTRTREENTSPPPAVHDLVAIERGSRRVVLTWRSDRNGDVSGYGIYRSEHADFQPGPATLVHTIEKPEPYCRQLYVDTQVMPRTSYWYRVVAIDIDNRRSPPTACRITLCDDPEDGKTSVGK